MRKNKIDRYQVKKANARTWQDSDEVGWFAAAEKYFNQLNPAVGKSVYIHVKHLYDDEIFKICFYREVKQSYHLVR